MKTSSSVPIIGIDLGTTASVAAVYHDDELVVVENARGMTPRLQDAPDRLVAIGAAAQAAF